MNNVDPEGWPRSPAELVVMAASGPRRAQLECFDACRRLARSRAAETMLVQSGKQVGVFRTHAYAPRVLIANFHWCALGELGAFQRTRPQGHDDVRPDDDGSWNLFRIGSRAM